MASAFRYVEEKYARYIKPLLLAMSTTANGTEMSANVILSAAASRSTQGDSADSYPMFAYGAKMKGDVLIKFK